MEGFEAGEGKGGEDDGGKSGVGVGAGDSAAVAAVLMLVDLLMVTPEAAKAETRHCHEPYVRLS